MAWSEAARRAALEARKRKKKGDYYRFAESNPDREAPVNLKKYGSRKGTLRYIGQQKTALKRNHFPDADSSDPKDVKFHRETATRNLRRARQALYGRQPKQGRRAYERAMTFRKAYGH